MTTSCCVGPGGAQDGVAVGGRARVVGRRRPPRRPAARLRLDVALPVLRETPHRVPASAGVTAGMYVTSAGWQVILCDPANLAIYPYSHETQQFDIRLRFARVRSTCLVTIRTAAATSHFASITAVIHLCLY